MVASGIAVAAAFMVMAISNVMASKKLFGGKDNKELSDENPTYLSPDGATFAIWGMIYLLELLLVVAQLFHGDELMERRCPLTGLSVRDRLVLAFLANALWLPVFNNEKFWAAMVIILVYLGFLLSVYSDVNMGTTHGIYEHLCLAAGIAMNTSWLVVASCVSGFLTLGRVGWRTDGVAGSVPAAALVIFIVMLLACQRAVLQCDLAWAFVAAWALRGIYRMQTVPDKVRFPLAAMNSNLGQIAKTCSYLVVLTMLGAAAYYFKSSNL